MRLTCPACAAQYEIEPNLIPGAGRMVQCEACSHRWIARPDAAATLEELEHEADLPRPSGLNPHVARILREEAEAERRLSRSQSDAPAPPLPQTETRAAPVDPKPAPAKAEASPSPGAQTAHTHAPTNTKPASSAAFGARHMDEVIAARGEDVRSEDPVVTGLLGVVALLLIAALIYTEADTIAAYVPALEGAMRGFTNLVDGFENWLRSIS